MKMRKTVFLGILAMALTMAFTACPGPNDTGLPTTGTVVGAVTFAGNASGSVTLELKTASGGRAYMYRVVTPDSTEVRFTEVTPGTFFLYAYVRGVREQLRYNVPVTAGGVYTLSGGITITTCGCGLGAGDGCIGQCTDTVCGCGLGTGDGCDCDYGTDTVCGCGLGTGDGCDCDHGTDTVCGCGLGTGDGCDCDYGTDTVCGCGLGSADACDCAQTVVTGIILSHTGTIYIPFNEYRIIYATMVPSTAAFQWVEWTVDSDLVTITRIPRRPRAGIFAGPETAILINPNDVGTATITATAMGSGPMELSATWFFAELSG